MASETSASVITLFQPRPKTGAERAKAYRDRKRAAGVTAHAPASTPTPAPAIASPVTPAPLRVTPSRVTPSRRYDASTLLAVAAFGLTATGITMNGWFAQSLASTDIAGWLFLSIGVAADLVALSVPSCAARLWQSRQRATAAMAWGVFLMTFAFAVTAGIGFASVNISDVTQERASRVTPAVTAAQTALSDAMMARDRECKGGVGKFCRERETSVATSRQTLEAATRTVAEASDPQTDAARRVVSWVTFGYLSPTANDFGMLRLVLLALLPQLGGILLMVGRGSRR
jgi:hypothetical protein